MENYIEPEPSNKTGPEEKGRKEGKLKKCKRCNGQRNDYFVDCPICKSCEKMEHHHVALNQTLNLNVAEDVLIKVII